MFLNRHKRLTAVICFVLSLSVLNLTIGCTHYLPETINKSLNVQQPDGTIVKRDYAVLHKGISVYKLTELKADAKGLMGKIQVMSTSTIVQTDSNKNFADEVHLYIDSDSALIVNEVSYIPFKTIEEIKLFSTVDQHLVKSIPRDKLSGGGIAGIIIGILVAVVIIGLAIACTCPMVDLYDGTTYQFSGEAFSGAVFPNLERDDYLMLKDIPAVDDNYQIRISNKLDEKQYTDLALLMLIEHPDNTRAFIDKYGNVLTTTAEVMPNEAIASDGRNYTTWLAAKDQNYFSFTDEPEGRLASSITMYFSKPINASSGKLIVSAGNSIWADYIFSSFYQLFGNKYDEWVASQEKVPAHKHIRWMLDQKIPLMIYIQTEKGWEFADYYYPVGSFSNREMAMNLDLSNVKEKDQVIIKIETGFMFWDLDYAAMDFTENAEFAVTDITPSSATDKNHANVIESLSRDDGNYLEHLNRGDEVILHYKAPVTEGKSQTVYLHSKGYFHHLKSFDNEPDIKLLKSFRKPGRLIEYSKQEYAVAKQQYTLQK